MQLSPINSLPIFNTNVSQWSIIKNIWKHKRKIIIKLYWNVNNVTYSTLLNRNSTFLIDPKPLKQKPQHSKLLLPVEKNRIIARKELGKPTLVRGIESIMMINRQGKEKKNEKPIATFKKPFWQIKTKLDFITKGRDPRDPIMNLPKSSDQEWHSDQDSGEREREGYPKDRVLRGLHDAREDGSFRGRHGRAGE